MYPCAHCGLDRADSEAECTSCGWRPTPLSGRDEHEFVSVLPPVYRATDWSRVLGYGSFVISAGLTLGAMGWLLVCFLVMRSNPETFGPPALVGFLQLFAAAGFAVTGWLFLNRSRTAKLTLVVSGVLLVIELVVVMFWFSMMVRQSRNLPRQSNVKFGAYLIASDSDSRTVVTIDKFTPMFGGISWSGTISADGIRPTQYTGWPIELVGRDTEPVAMVWHNDPDWVEITMSDGKKLKLEWNAALLIEAQNSSELHHYVAPEFSRLR